MASSIAKARLRPVSWNAWEKIEPFTVAVKAHLGALKATGRVPVLPQAALTEAQLDKVILAIWCVCQGGLQWRTVALLTDVPFATVYSCFARWTRLGLWTRLLRDLMRRWRQACGDGPEPPRRW